MPEETDSSDHLELAYASFAIFADDGTLDLSELNFLLGLALKDGKVDEMEREILAGVLNRITEPQVSAAVWKRITAVRRKHGI
jgi:hypothetical protein